MSLLLITFVRILSVLKGYRYDCLLFVHFMHFNLGAKKAVAAGPFDPRLPLVPLTRGYR